LNAETACGKTPKSAAGALKEERLQAAPYIVFRDSRHSWKAVPFQNSNAGSFPAVGFGKGFSRADKRVQNMSGFSRCGSLIAN
jgi:hypothetical protein